MNAYHFFELGLVVLIVAFSALFSIRQTLPKAAARLGEAARRKGVPAAVANFLFGAARTADCGCGQCSGCGPASPTQTVTLHRNKSCH